MAAPSLEPHTLAERAADAGMTAIRDYLADEGATVGHMIILLGVEGGPPDEEDEVTCGSNLEGPTDLVATVGAHFVSAMREMGMNVKLIPMPRPPGRG